MPPRRAIRPNAYLLSPEAWMRVCIDLDQTPRKVFMLICAVKGLNAWLNDAWWESYWRAHVRHLHKTGHFPHWYMQTNTLGQMRPQMCKPILLLVYGLQCSICGCRYHHRINNQMKKRICRDCTQEQHISNVVLHAEYGIDFAKVIDDFEPFVRYLPLRPYGRTEIKMLSRNPLDLQRPASAHTLFFWLPDIRRLYDLPAMRLEQRERVANVNFLKAAFKRRYAQGIGRRYKAETLYRNEVSRITNPMTPVDWLPGGPCMARCRSRAYSMSHQEQVALRSIKARLRLWHPVPILGAREYVLKTAMCKLNLNAATLQPGRWEVPVTRHPSRIYTVDETP